MRNTKPDNVVEYTYTCFSLTNLIINILTQDESVSH